jgi:hypothetical protein
MPKDVAITNQFGSYNIHYKTNGNTILLTRTYERIAGKFPPTEYNSMVSFYNAIYKADHSRIVFVKKEG